MLIKNGIEVNIINIPEEGILLLRLNSGLIFEDDIYSLLKENNMEDIDKEILNFFKKENTYNG